MVTSRGNILHVMDVIEEHCTLYKLLDLGFICTQAQKCSSENKEGVNVEGVLTGKNKHMLNRTEAQICSNEDFHLKSL